MEKKKYSAIQLPERIAAKVGNLTQFVDLKSSVDAPAVAVSVAISLTESEKEFFSLLERFHEAMCPHAVIRVAGGWIRDKLLGKNCSDVDLVVNHTTGTNFAESLQSWLEIQNSIIKIHKIKQNPDQSKYLEVARFLFKELSVDVVNLRKDSYVANSRRPIIALGTPREDALRRDFTVNSLFYNIHSKRIEDYTGLGIEDFNSKVLRSSLKAAIILEDDPLRAIRAVRFIAQLKFQISKELFAACASPSIHQKLDKLVSPQRTGQEIMKLFDLGDTMMIGMIFLYETHLFPHVFQLEEPYFVGWEVKSREAYLAMEELLLNDRLVHTLLDITETSFAFDKEEKLLLRLAAVLYPFFITTVSNSTRDEAIRKLLTKYIPLGKKYADRILQLLDGVKEFLRCHTLHPLDYLNAYNVEGKHLGIKFLGKFLRKYKSSVQVKKLYKLHYEDFRSIRFSFGQNIERSIGVLCFAFLSLNLMNDEETLLASNFEAIFRRISKNNRFNRALIPALIPGDE
ncbi:tRna nucleotidyltransferase/poly(A) polymerase family protein, partial [Cardiosporidium cionae]